MFPGRTAVALALLVAGLQGAAYAPHGGAAPPLRVRLRGGCADAGYAAADALRGLFQEPEAFFEPPPPPGRASYRRPSAGPDEGQLVQLITAGRSPLWVSLIGRRLLLCCDIRMRQRRTCVAPDANAR